MGNHVLACAFCRSPLVDNISPGDVAGRHDTSCCLHVDDLLQHGGWNHQVRLRMDVCTAAEPQLCCRSCLRFSYNSLRWLHTEESRCRRRWCLGRAQDVWLVQQGASLIAGFLHLDTPGVATGRCLLLLPLIVMN